MCQTEGIICPIYKKVMLVIQIIIEELLFSVVLENYSLLYLIVGYFYLETIYLLCEVQACFHKGYSSLDHV